MSFSDIVEFLKNMRATDLVVSINHKIGSPGRYDDAQFKFIKERDDVIITSSESYSDKTRITAYVCFIDPEKARNLALKELNEAIQRDI